MDLVRPGHGRRAEADDGAAGDHRGPRVRLRRLDGAGDCGHIVTVDGLHVPAGGGEPGALIGGRGEVRGPVDGDAVVVPQEDQLAERQVAGEVDRLVADAFHQAPVTAQRVGEVIDDIVAEARRLQPLGKRHADRVGDALAEWTGGRLDPRRVAVLRVACGSAAELAEVLQLLARHILEAEEVVDGVEKHRAVAGGVDNPVAVRPVRHGRIDIDEPLEQNRYDVGHPHRQAWMAGLRLLYRIHREEADGVRHRTRRPAGGDLGHTLLHQGQAFLLCSMRRRIIGVRMSCIARSSFGPGITIEFARVIHEFVQHRDEVGEVDPARVREADHDEALVRRRDPAGDEGVGRVDDRHALKVDVRLGELRADRVNVGVHPAQDHVGHRLRGVATRRLVPVDLLDPLEIDHRDDADLEVGVLRDLVGLGHHRAVKAFVEQEIRTRRELAPGGELARRDTEAFGLRVVMDVVPGLPAAGLAIDPKDVLQLVEDVGLGRKVRECVVPLGEALLQLGFHVGAVVAMEGVALDGDGTDALAPEDLVEGMPDGRRPGPG